jgi:RNA polymerase sigma-70 factor (ECF subfamily)
MDTSVELLRRAREGEDRALERLMARYLPPFRAWARHRCPRWVRDGLDTDDLVQETLLQTVRHVQDFEPRQDGALLAYMRQALRNRIRDEIRRAQRRGRAVTLPSKEPDFRPSPLQETIGNEVLERYEAALERLDVSDREIILARMELKHSWDEVAAVLGKPSADAARKAAGRALRRLAEEMSRGA